MPDINISFCRSLLAQVVPVVQDNGYRPIKDGWVWHGGRDNWEFHGPDDFYWYGSADNAYEARYKGWVAFLASKSIDADGSPIAKEEQANG